MFMFYAIFCMIVNGFENKDVFNQWKIGYRSGIEN